MWTKKQAQRRADELGFVWAQPERAIRETAARAAAALDLVIQIGDVCVIPWDSGRGYRDIRFVLPASWSDQFVLQLVIEDQIREALKAEREPDDDRTFAP